MNKFNWWVKLGGSAGFACKMVFVPFLQILRCSRVKGTGTESKDIEPSRHDFTHKEDWPFDRTCRRDLSTSSSRVAQVESLRAGSAKGGTVILSPALGGTKDLKIPRLSEMT